MTWGLFGALAAVTVLSRVAPMALLPAPGPRVRRVLDALPAPLFACLGVHALLPDGEGPTLAAAAAVAGSLVGASRRSLGLTLASGLVGYLVVAALT